MTTPDDRSAPFTASDEAFFQAGSAPARELPSERPVTLEGEDGAPDEALAVLANGARRARFVRPVRSTLIALSVLASVGLLRHVWRADSAELAAGAPASVPAAENDSLATAAAAELGTDGVPADDDAPLLTLSTCDGCTSVEPLTEAPSPQISEAPLFGPPAPAQPSPPVRAVERAPEHAKAKPLVRAPAQHRARPPHSPRRAAPVNKAALLRALRSS